MAATSAAAELAIAKASLTAVLLRPDPAPCSRADIDEFARQLALTAARCSPANVQTCKRWMLQHVTPSPARTAAVGRYLVALANSFPPVAPSSTATTNKGAKQTSSRRKRLHLLYIINDVLFHVTFRGDNSNGSVKPLFTTSIEPFLEPLVASAASFVRAPKQLAKIRSLLDLWAEKHYVAGDALARSRTAVDDGPHLAEEKLQKELKQDLQRASTSAAASGASKEAPFILPAFHGDPSTPWYDLPAANWLAVLEANSTRPMNPASLKPLQMTPGPAPPALIASVQALLADVDRMFDEGGDRDALNKPENTDMDSDVDALGEHIEIDVFSGDILGGDTYYGWSRAFCKSMKERHRRRVAGGGPNLDLPGAGSNRGRGRDNRGQSQDSRSSSYSPKPSFKKRRISASPSPTQRDARRRSRSQSWSPSRSRSRSRGREEGSRTRLHVPGRQHHDRKASSSRSPSHHSHHGNRYRQRSRSRTRSRSRSRSRSKSWQESRSPHRHRGRDADRDRDRYSKSPHKSRYDNDEQYLARRTPPPHLQHHLPPVPYHQQQQSLQNQHPLHHQAHPGAPPPPYPPYPPYPGAGGFPFVPPPPVPPPGYQGPWPPPLPPMPHQMMPGQGQAPNAWTGDWAAPPPPPPTPPPPQQQYQQRQQHHSQYPPHDHYQQRQQQRNHSPYEHRPQQNQGDRGGSWDRARGR